MVPGAGSHRACIPIQLAVGRMIESPVQARYPADPAPETSEATLCAAEGLLASQAPAPAGVTTADSNDGSSSHTAQIAQSQETLNLRTRRNALTNSSYRERYT